MQILPWFVVCFWEAWCSDGKCQAESTYKKVTELFVLQGIRESKHAVQSYACCGLSLSHSQFSGLRCPSVHVAAVHMIKLAHVDAAAADTLTAIAACGPRQATGVVWNLMVCLTLFSLANFLKAVLTKLLSSHFYRSAHFKKVGCPGMGGGRGWSQLTCNGGLERNTAMLG